jgi:pyruvate ferredoxin oxidoreductase alpha subunit
MAIIRSKEVIKEIMEEFGKAFGRTYKPVETYNLEDADVAFIALGAITENIMTAIDELKKEGKKAGLINLRLFRPFPAEEFLSAIKDVKRIAVIERVLPGGATNSPVFNEVSSLAFRAGLKPVIENFVLALGGRDVMPEEFQMLFDRVITAKPRDMKLKEDANFEMIGVRG